SPARIPRARRGPARRSARPSPRSRAGAAASRGRAGCSLRRRRRARGPSRAFYAPARAARRAERSASRRSPARAARCAVAPRLASAYARPMPDPLLVRPVGPYALARSREFLCGFAPARGTCDAESETLRVAFRLDRTFEAAGAAVRERGDSLAIEV